MASGGEDNPFSFKNFIKTKDQNDEGGTGNEPDDIFDLPDVPSEPKPKEQASVRDENPFSFKKFLSKGTGEAVSGARPKSSQQSSQPGSTGSGSRTIHMTDAELAAANPVSSDLASDLPDFVQDHFNTVESPRGRKSSRHMELPDFALDSNNSLYDPPSPMNLNSFIIDIPASNALRTESSNHLFSNDSDMPGTNGLVSSMHGSLPDFISDSNISDHIQQNTSDGAFGGANERNSFDDPSGNMQHEIRRLRHENDELRRELTESHRSAQEESERVTKVMRDMEAIQRRESEETSALERMVQQVEANLETTTARAVKAETSNTKLKQEMKSLKVQVASLQNENQALRSGDTCQSSGRERTQQASRQLMAAADAAQQQLQALLTGVDNLRMVSRVLESIDKITDEEDPIGGAPG